METNALKNQTEPWTNEKHVHFLNSMEASFVRTMLENNTHLIRLDRFVPDSSESTLDLKSVQIRNIKHGAGTSDVVVRRTRIYGRPDMRTRRVSSQRYDPSQDQVVPQLGNRIGDKDEKDPPNLMVASLAPVK